MQRKLLIIFATVVAILIFPIALRKNSAFLGSVGGEDVVVSRSIVPIIKGGEVNVYSGEQKVFGLWQDAFDSPLFIYPFADHERYLCVYNWDTAILVFVVDLNSSRTNLTANWPEMGGLRQCFTDAATNLVLNFRGVVRLATEDELQEVRDYLSRTAESRIEAISLPYCDLGVWRHYVNRDGLLLDLATNRQHYWPMPGAP